MLCSMLVLGYKCNASIVAMGKLELHMHTLILIASYPSAHGMCPLVVWSCPCNTLQASYRQWDLIFIQAHV